MDQYLYIAAATAAVVAISIYWFLKPHGKTPPLPPGPRGLPVVGYIPFLGADLLQQFTDLARRYGPIYRLWLGHKLCIVITSPALVKEVVRDQDLAFAYRDCTEAALVLSHGADDIVFSPYGSTWRAMRRILMQHMQSKGNLEASLALRRDECRKAVRQVHSRVGQAVNVGELTFGMEIGLVMNLLWGGTIVGEKGERLGAEFRDVLRQLNHLLGKPNVSDFFPELAWLDLQGIRKQMVKVMEYIDQILHDLMSQADNKLLLSQDDHQIEGRKDFLQVLAELKKTAKSELSDLTQRQLQALLQNIMLGGTDQAATIIEFAMAHLISNPETMAKAQHELSQVVGLDNVVEEFHLPKLQYLEAVVKETLRLHPPVPFLIPRCPNQSCIVGGFTVPKDAKVFINTWAIHRDPTFWENPAEFKPERFQMEAAGKWDFSGNNFSYLPFGSGRRICPGVPLAEKMVSHLLASLLHSFDWKLPEGQRVDMEENVGLVLGKKTPLLAIPTPRMFNIMLYT